MIFVLIAFLVLRVEHIGRKVKIVAFILIGLLLYFSIMNLLTADSIDLTSPKGVVNAVYLYFGWLGKTASALWDVGKETVNMVGDVINFNATSG